MNQTDTNMATFRAALERIVPAHLKCIGVEFRFRDDATGWVLATGAEFMELETCNRALNIPSLATHRMGKMLNDLADLRAAKETKRMRELAETAKLIGVVNQASGYRPQPQPQILEPGVLPIIRPEGT